MVDCGCKTGCFEMENPTLESQRECKLKAKLIANTSYRGNARFVHTAEFKVYDESTQELIAMRKTIGGLHEWMISVWDGREITIQCEEIFTEQK